jgi:hypothetical protein
MTPERLPARRLWIRVEGARWTSRIGTGDVRVAAPTSIVLELVVEARPVHPFERFVRFAVPFDRSTAADADRRGF